MIFYIHYILLTSGLSGTSVLLGVYLKNYSDASQREIGFMLMSFPFICIFVKPLFCSMADRSQAHKNYLIMSLAIMLLGYSPYIVVPFFPAFYQNQPRVSWYLLFVSGQVGNCGLGVAWSLGDSLAVNKSQRTGTPYSRMRLMGTISWGFYGYVIGLINEAPFLPKYIASFLTMNISVLIEILLIIAWNDEDFKMGDSTDELSSKPSDTSMSIEFDNLNAKPLALNSASPKDLNQLAYIDECTTNTTACDATPVNTQEPMKEKGVKKRDLQWTVFKLIYSKDGRLIKYLILFTIGGFLVTPMNFLFISLSHFCQEKACNFSHLAGSILIAQASIETLCFLVLPWVLTRISRSLALYFALLIMTIRYFFYSIFYYSSDISPYWAVVGECAHGIMYGVFCTIMADVALMFANEARLFIPELRKKGLLSEKRPDNQDQVHKEEDNIKVVLRATMQAMFGGFMDGLGVALGSIACGLLSDMYSFVLMWQVFLAIGSAALVTYVINELARTRWSDRFRPSADSKAYEILAMSKAAAKSKTHQQPPTGDERLATAIA